MIKIDWFTFVYDHVWFGWYIYNITSDDHKDDRFYTFPKFITDRLEDEDWPRARWHHGDCEAWEFLWPFRKYGESPPNWWLNLWRVAERDSEDIKEYEK